MVITFPAQAAVKPAGNPDAVPMPLALVVACVMLVSACPAHNVGLLEAAPAVLAAPELFTTMVPVAFTAPQPPVSGIL